MKSLYPKAKAVTLKKRKIGPNHKIMQFAFVIFENESDCADALKAHTQIGVEKVNVSYAFAKPDEKQKPTTTDSNRKPATPTENTNKKQQTKPVEKQTVTNVIYVGQLPENAEESDIKKTFPQIN